MQERLQRAAARLGRSVEVGAIQISLFADTEQVVIEDLRFPAPEPGRLSARIGRVSVTLDVLGAIAGEGRGAVERITVEDPQVVAHATGSEGAMRALARGAREELAAYRKARKEPRDGPARALPALKVAPIDVLLDRAGERSPLARAHVSPPQGDTGWELSATLPNGQVLDVGVRRSAGGGLSAHLTSPARIPIPTSRVTASIASLEVDEDGRARARDLKAERRIGEHLARLQAGLVIVQLRELAEQGPIGATLHNVRATIDGQTYGLTAEKLTLQTEAARKHLRTAATSITVRGAARGAQATATVPKATAQWVLGDGGAPTLRSASAAGASLKIVLPWRLKRLKSLVKRRLRRLAGAGSGAPALKGVPPRRLLSRLLGAVPQALRTVVASSKLSLRDATLRVADREGAEARLSELGVSVDLGEPGRPVTLEGVASFPEGALLGDRGHSFRVEGGLDLRADPLELRIAASKLGAGRVLARMAPRWRVPAAFELDVDLSLRWERLARRLTVSGKVVGRKAGVYHRQLAEEPVSGIDFTARGLSLTVDLKAAGTKAEPTIRLDPGELVVGPAPGDARGSPPLPAKLGGSLVVERATKKPAFELKVGWPRQRCQAFLAAIPKELLGPLADMTVAGTLSFDARLYLDFLRPKASRLKIHGDWSDCRPVSLGERFDRKFARLKRRSFVFRWPGGSRVGPGAKSWIPLDQMPEYVPGGAIMTEDGAFYRHGGFIVSSMQRALKYALERGYLWYGGSTITQQLVKNIFLNRRKLLARKVREALLTWAMERRFTKDYIMALYLNMIEYGPELYGIGPASRFYFGKSAKRITPLETAFLMGLKPQPKWGYSLWKKNKTSKRWRKLLKSILTRMSRKRYLSPEDVEAAAPYILTFRRP